MMRIRYFEPLGRAFTRTSHILFEPFDLGKWFVLGFACWLARFLSSGGGGGASSSLSGLESSVSAAEAAPLGVVAREPGSWASLGVLAQGGPDAAEIIGIGCAVGCVLLLILALVLVLTWLGARGQFIFLDGVLANRAAIAEPWRRFREQGNSLFLWFLGFLVACITLFLIASVPLLLVIAPWDDGGGDPLWWLVLPSLIPIFLTLLVIGYTKLFLLDFVVPIMHREGLRTTAAWGRFLPLLKRHFGHLLLYGLFVLGLRILAGFAILAIGIATCCIGLLVVILPYIGTVALLPLWVALRAFSVEYLGQMLPEHDFWGDAADGTVGDPAVPAPAV